MINEGAVLAAQEENRTLRGKLEECARQLQGNEQMIRWLNNQVNEAHLGHAFKPTLPHAALQEATHSSAANLKLRRAAV